MNFGEHLFFTRKRCRLSQTAVAASAGISHSALSKIERGTVDPSFATALALIKALGQEPKAFFQHHLRLERAKPPAGLKRKEMKKCLVLRREVASMDEAQQALFLGIYTVVRRSVLLTGAAQ